MCIHGLSLNAHHVQYNAQIIAENDDIAWIKLT